MSDDRENVHVRDNHDWGALCSIFQICKLDLESISVSIFVDDLVEFDNKVQISILIPV